MKTFTTLATIGLAATAAARPFEERDADASASVYTFADIEPSENLTWVSCFDDPSLRCANLIVPLDYDDDSNTDTTSIAWIKYISSDDENAPEVIFNPGGPGGSGVDYLAGGGGGDLANVTGTQFNIVAFDPRGVNNSGPALTCYPGDLAKWKNSATLSSQTAPLPEQYQDNKAAGQFCSEANTNTNAKYSNTVAVVQDIMYYVDLSHTARGLDGEAMAYYYGASYGTVIGQTLAALYPERIGRMLLDGNVYGEQYYTGVVSSALDNSDETFLSFFQYCYAAGPDECNFYHNATSQQDLQDRYVALLQALKEEPLIYSNISITNYPGIIKDVDVIDLVYDMMYQAWVKFTDMGIILRGLELRKPDAYLKYKASSAGSSMSRRTMPLPNTLAPPLYNKYDSGEALTLITCMDANKKYPIDTYDEFLDTRNLFIKESSFYGNEMSLANMIMCLGMGSELYPPKSQIFPGFVNNTHTSFPILFTNNMADPITPLSSAEKMSDMFEGSRVVRQNATGHCATNFSTNNKCLRRITQEYFGKGWMPAEGKMCQPDRLPFDPYP